MSHKIKVLDDHLTNMIAAGEVVERPAGIIKELIENAIDAHASHISVHIKDGGMSLIEVSDNGEGMDPVDLKQAFQRHSTSKIHDKNDLGAIKSFGFRGEALPSIASVTHTFAHSKTQDTEGWFVDIDNGRIMDEGAHARNLGTTISVQDLFLKTPARLKYIKSIRYENSIILDTVQKFALGHPDIAFNLFSDGKEVYRSLGNGSLFDVFARIYGSRVAGESLEFKESNFDFEIEGVMALPMHSRASRNAIILYVNNRMIRFPKVQNAIIKGYRRHMASDRFPMVVMNIIVDPQLVDVNVHPSKWEIRLSKEDVLQELIIDSFERLLSEHMRPQRINDIAKEKVEQLDILEPLIDNQAYMPQSEPVVSVSSANEIEEAAIVAPIFKSVDNSPSIDDVFEAFSTPLESKVPEVGIKEETIEASIERKPSIEPLRVLSQFSGKYILAQGDEGLYIIDQHAAMERIRYEYYQNMLLEHQYSTQTLLVPLIFEGRQILIEQIYDVNQYLAQFQIHLDIFGEDALALREYPLWIKEKEVFEFVDLMLDEFQNESQSDKESIRENALATLACHSSVRFNEYLSHAEMEKLVSDLRACEQGYHCPHGRPTFVLVDHAFLLKEFKR